ncbi:hypothetical protein PUNSTDRAFT_62553, partial [Punctularia strigosozonata HHB-11173 SS5]|uniref:uncharacterized protein n=1 Tax=Punctularia strigosozonata (strain HHB-11173) TaxID=741275 RepID=UPI0004417F35
MPIVTRRPRAYLDQTKLALYRRFERDGQVADLYEAFEVAKQALSAGPPNGSARTYTLATAGGILTGLFEVSDVTESDLDQLVAWRQEALRLAPPGHHSRPYHLNNVAEALQRR